MLSYGVRRQASLTGLTDRIASVEMTRLFTLNAQQLTKIGIIDHFEIASDAPQAANGGGIRIIRYAPNYYHV